MHILIEWRYIHQAHQYHNLFTCIGCSIAFAQNSDVNPQYTAQLFVRLYAATVDGNQLNAELIGWVFLIGSRQRLLQTVAECIAALSSDVYSGLKTRDDSPLYNSHVD